MTWNSKIFVIHIENIEAYFIVLAVEEAAAQETKTSLSIPSRKNILSQPLHMNLLWKDKPFADVTFVVENEEIQAHRIILLKCHYFQNMFNSIENFLNNILLQRWNDGSQFK